MKKKHKNRNRYQIKNNKLTKMINKNLMKNNNNKSNNKKFKILKLINLKFRSKLMIYMKTKLMIMNNPNNLNKRKLCSRNNKQEILITLIIIFN